METNILMESGTNELEVLEFTVGNNHYGINVAKIKEIVQYSPVTPVPNSHPCVEGIFMPRDLMITVVDLAKVIKAQPSPDITKDMFIITNFNQLNVAFHVHSVVGIHVVVELYRACPGIRTIISNLCLTLSQTVFGGNQNNTISSTRTVNG